MAGVVFKLGEQTGEAGRPGEFTGEGGGGGVADVVGQDSYGYGVGVGDWCWLREGGVEGGLGLREI